MKKPFYGWIILGAGILGTLASIPGQTVGVSVFTDFLLEVHDISRSGISLAYLVGTVGSALMLPVAGRAYDRFGARAMGVPVAAALSLTLLFLSASDGAARLLGRLLPVAPAALSFAVLTAGFFLVRFFGQGSLTMLSRNMVMKWFDRRRGVANAFLGVSVSLGFSASPGVIDRIITTAGWRETWRIMAGILALFALFVFLVFRDKPSDMGLLPDGEWKEPDSKKDRLSRLTRIASLPEEDFTLTEARRTAVFWLLALTLSMSALLVTAITFHVVSIFEVAGIGRERAVALFLPASIIAVLTQFAGSAVSDYVRERAFVIVQLAGVFLISCVGLGMGGVAAQLFFIFGMGLSQGMMGITSAITWPRLFGLPHLGAITGFTLALSVAGSALGPFAYSVSLDLFGSYRASGLLFAALSLLLILFALLKKSFKPVKPEKE